MKAAKIAKIVAIVMLIYVGIVVLFESLLGFFQPEAGATMLITSYDEAGNGHDRVVARLESNGSIYVAANHWPRAWYREALDNPRMSVSFEGDTTEYRVSPVEGAEHERVDNENSLGLVFRILTGFPPRYFVRLDPN
ncbi:MAG: hypothetical protein CMQ15_02370 [Gammaproteobacteria bacterium]|jgi:hypothetical protein|nr:hypothetical protein [Gammaproteobacteria bacterium]HJN94550.1 hypothetical protein [Gammaproteobacteria bacterium]|tara:strand:+ start:9502 stop:9912 length:411 start_codon:yes stop_codon:yes gene_type:complete